MIVSDGVNVDRWRRELAVALDAVGDGAFLARHIREQTGDRAWLKADRSPVTVADFAVQALVAHRLVGSFPDDPLVAEEDAAPLRAPSGRQLADAVVAALQDAAPNVAPGLVFDLIDRGRAAPASRFWTLDPVDGTRGFVRGDQYVVALSLIVAGHVEVAAIGCPAMPPVDPPGSQPGWIACAVRGCGAYAASLHGGPFSRLCVSSCRDVRSARVVRPFEAGHFDVARLEAILRTLGVQSSPVLMDSQAKHLLVAAGRADLFIRVPATPAFRDKIWDQAAASLIIEEAGGRVTDLNGNRLDFGVGRLLAANQGVVASNGLLHAAALEAIHKAR
jgi:3'(2'), 5'-bisphosphate nucleotidase